MGNSRGLVFRTLKSSGPESIERKKVNNILNFSINTFIEFSHYYYIKGVFRERLPLPPPKKNRAR